MTDDSLVAALPERLERALERVLERDEVVEIKLKGAFKEGLICTDRRVLIIKGGFMTGHLFGTNVFQLPYSRVGSVEVTYHMLTGYFEISAGGMQNTGKRYWSTKSSEQPHKAPNCIALTGKPQADMFNRAATFILTRVHEPQDRSRSTQSDPLAKLLSMRDDGLVSPEEFEAKRREIIARL